MKPNAQRHPRDSAEMESATHTAEHVCAMLIQSRGTGQVPSAITALLRRMEALAADFCARQILRPASSALAKEFVGTVRANAIHSQRGHSATLLVLPLKRVVA